MDVFVYWCTFANLVVNEPIDLVVKYVEVVEVLGIRSSLTGALDNKRSADSVVDSISAEDLGKFPDQNIAESLQRISGVFIDRQSGEGSKITVRGFGPEFNTVRLNNRTIATIETGEVDYFFSDVNLSAC